MSRVYAIPPLFEGEDVEELQKQIDKIKGYEKQKRNWENAFQAWSNRCALDDNVTDSFGCCGYGAMCDYCTDNSYGRPCVRALNEMCREKRLEIDYSNRNFEEIWRVW